MWIDSEGNALPLTDGVEHGDGVLARLADTDGTDGVEAYHTAMKLVYAQRDKPVVIEDEHDDPHSIFDHARSAFARLTRSHAADDFARGLLRSLPPVERAAVEDEYVEDDARYVAEMMGEDECA